jgi:hypothetical protein
MKKFITALFVAGLVLSGGMALASIPDSGGVIHGCYLTTGPPQARGALRVVDTDAGQACVSGEIALTWNQTGPQGPVGPTGATGPAGPTGPAGSSIIARLRDQVASAGVCCTVTRSTNLAPWTQGATSLELFRGLMTLQSTGCHTLSGTAYLDGSPFASFDGIIVAGTTTINFPVTTLWEPGSAIQHTLSMNVTFNCNDQQAANTATVDVAVDIVEFS